MLVLTRNLCDSIKIGNNIDIKFLAIENGQVRIGINAPKNVAINRNKLNKKQRYKMINCFSKAS